MSLFGQTKRHTPSHKAGRRSPLPIFTNDGAEKKFDISTASSPSSRFFTTVYIPLPRLSLRQGSSGSSSPLNGTAKGMNGLAPPMSTSTSKAYHDPYRKQRYVRLCVPIPPRLYTRLQGTSRRLKALLAVLAVLGLVIFLLGFRKSRTGGTTWNPPFSDPSTLVFTPEEVASIWEWEVLSGHHPGLGQAPDHVSLPSMLQNPAVPETLLPAREPPAPLVAYNQRSAAAPRTLLVGDGPERYYLSAWDSTESQPGFPARPTPGTILDLDIVYDKCNFKANNYVRDCLEFLRIGGGLDNGRRVRRGNYLSQYKQIYYESTSQQRQFSLSPRPSTDDELDKRKGAGLSRDPLALNPVNPVVPSFTSKDPCDPLHPKIFHMFWAGPFTDKPYMAVTSFLFTQNLGLDQPLDESSEVIRGVCRPQFWVWINPGPAAAVPNPSAKREMYEQLATNPWSAPFLHERFREVVKFRMWNTTEQLDGIPEMKDHWRTMPIFNSGGTKYKQPTYQQAAPEPEPAPEAASSISSGDEPNMGEVLAAEAAEATSKAAAQPKKKDALFEKVGSTSESDYDRLSVILSDMARFVLTYRYGGIYLDADTIFLRDWEELWNYRGAFAYRWSWHDKYNTAVLKMHKGSALGKFLFQTVLENDLDFHPMTVTKYLKDAGLEKLLFEVPDALFDPAWLNMERYQRDRPPFPYFPEFSQFFSNDKFESGGPQPLGFDGFFRGAFSYHFHNFWWLPFDPSRNFPDLGQRFIKGERALRDAAAAKLRPTPPVLAGGEAEHTALTGGSKGKGGKNGAGGVHVVEDMDDELDLSWATVLKRSFEAYLRAERPNMYGEWITWDRRGSSAS